MLRIQYEAACKEVRRLKRTIKVQERAGVDSTHEYAELAKYEQQAKWAAESGAF
jgi:hypothetical protein